MKSGFFHLQRIVLVPALQTGCSRGTNKAVVNLAPTMILAKVVASVSCEEKNKQLHMSYGFSRERSRKHERRRLLVNFYHYYWNDWEK